MAASPERPRRLSLCMIVKDEEDFLPGCLASVGDLADEVIVVDTGSADRTVALAEAAGATVVRRPWTADFAAARNASLDAATGDWVLVLDADERLAPGSAAQVRRLIDAEPADAPPTVYLPLIENRDKDGKPLGAGHMPRLWRRRPELRFTGRVHEQVGVGVAGLRQRYEDAFHILHYGYDPDLQAQRGKRARNTTLLEAQLAERPGDPTATFYLAREHYAGGDDAAALAGFRAVIADGAALNHVLSSHVFAVECLRSLGRSREAMDHGLAAVLEHPGYPELWFVTGLAANDVALPIRAEACFREAAKAHPPGLGDLAFRDTAVRAWRARLEWARSQRQIGQARQAVATFAAVRPQLPPDERVAADIECAELLLDLGDETKAFGLISAHFDERPDAVTPLLLRFVQLYVDLIGLAKAYEVLHNCLMQHPALLHQLPLVGAAVDLAEALGNEDDQLEYLQICTHLKSPHPEHYLALARLLNARGESGAAAQALQVARALIRRGD